MLIIVDRYTGPQYRRPCKPLSSIREKTPVSRAFGLWETVATLASVSPAFDSGKRWLPSHRLRRLGVPVIFLSSFTVMSSSLIFSILAIPTNSCRWLMKFDPGDNLGLSGVSMEEG
ncbi:hypothetical protein YC2023_083828 [Brassica napus]